MPKAHSVAFTSTLKMPLFFPITTFQGGKAVLRHFPCSECHHGVSLAPGILWLVIPNCHWPCIPAYFSSSACSRNLFTLSLSRRKYSHILPRTSCFPIIFQSLPRCACAPRTLSTATLSVVFLLIPSKNRCNISGVFFGQCMILSPPTPTARS